MSVPRLRHLVTATAAFALLAAAPADALAATHHSAPRSHAARHFTARGLIVSHTATTATVLVRSLRDGRAVRRNATITVRLTAPHRSRQIHAHVTAPALTDGNLLTLAGTATGSGTDEQFDADTAVQQTAPAHVFLGTVTAVDSTLITLTKADRSSDDGNGDGQSTFTVDVSQAAVTVDGAAGGTMAPGQFAAVLGEGDHDTLLAASVYAYSAAPALTGGEVSAVNGTVVTMGEDDASTDVDLSTAALVLNGNPGATVDQITSGDRLVVLGRVDGSGTFTATTAFAFNSGDSGPVGENQD